MEQIVLTAPQWVSFTDKLPAIGEEIELTAHGGGLAKFSITKWAGDSRGYSHWRPHISFTAGIGTVKISYE